MIILELPSNVQKGSFNELNKFEKSEHEARIKKSWAI